MLLAYFKSNGFCISIKINIKIPTITYEGTNMVKYYFVHMINALFENKNLFYARIKLSRSYEEYSTIISLPEACHYHCATIGTIDFIACSFNIALYCNNINHIYLHTVFTSEFGLTYIVDIVIMLWYIVIKVIV